MELLEKSMVFVTGKGGVGKTTLSLALGTAAASAGKRVIVCEVAAQEQAGQILGAGDGGYEEVEVAEGLHAISIDPDEATREYLEHRLPLKAMGELLYRSRIFTYLAAATPGLAEMVTLGKVWELAAERRRVAGGEPYDLVIVDAPATGHGVGFLQTPQTFVEIARVGPLAEQAATIDRGLRNRRRTGVVVVATPEEMPVSEAVAIEAGLADSPGIAVDAILMNALYPHRFEPAELDRIERASGGDRRGREEMLAAVAAHDRRGLLQRRQLERLRELSAAPVSELPYLFTPAIDPEAIATLARQLR